MTTVYTFRAGYTKLGIATAPSSAPTITVVDTSNNVLVNAQATTALTNIAGVYIYSYSGADNLDLIGLFHTTDATIDAQDIFSSSYDALILATISVETAPLATSAAVGLVSSVVNTLPTAAEIDAQLSGTHGAGTWGNGSGSTSTTVTVDDGVNPKDGVDVWISTDSAGTNVVARGSTGALGTVVFMLDPGTYYAWKQLAGYDFTNPQSFTVS